MRETRATLLACYPAGPIFNIAGAETLVGRDRL